MIDIAPDAVVEEAGFTEYDVDLGTSGLCGTFALALKSAFPHLGLALLCLSDFDGSPLRNSRGELHWRHVVATDGDQLFDIDGRVRLDDLIQNYCWDNPKRGGGCLVAVNQRKLIAILHSDMKSFDRRYLEKWSAMLIEGERRLKNTPMQQYADAPSPV